MNRPQDNPSYSPVFTHEHAETIKQLEKKVGKLDRIVCGESTVSSGLQERVADLEKGLLIKALNRINWTILGGVVAVLTLAVAIVFGVLDLIK